MRALCLVLALSAVGCAPASVRRGDSFAMADDWERAAQAYREASVQRPGSGRVAAKLQLADRMLQQQRLAEADQARQRAEAALAEGDYTRAFAELGTARALDPESEPIRELAIRAADEVRRLAEERARSQGWQAAYPLAVLALRLSPGDAQAVALVTRARTGVLEALDQTLAGGDFEAAMVVAGQLGELEPELAGEVRAKVARAWSAALVTDAAALDAAGKDGEAWLTYARAASLHPSEAAVAGRAKLHRAIVEAHRVSLRVRPPKEALAADALALVRTKLAGDGLGESPRGAVVLEDLQARWSCDEQVTKRTESARYVASTRWVDNPDRRQAEARAYEARAEVPEREADAAQAWSHVESKRYRAEQLKADWRILEDAALRAEETVAATEAWVEEARRGLSAAEADLSAASSRGEDSSAWASVRDDWADELRARDDQLDDVASDARSLRSDADQLASEASRAERDVDSAQDDYERAQRAVAEALSAVDRADAAAAALPTEIEEPVYATFAYPAYEVVRTCTVQASAKLGPASAPSTRRFEASRTVTDRHHEAYPDYGVAEDALALGATDPAMVQHALDDVASSLVRAVRIERDAVYAALAADTDPAARAALLVLSPSHGDPGWLRGTWGLEPSAL